MRAGRSFGRELLVAVLATLIVAFLMWLLTGDGRSETVLKLEYRHAPASVQQP